MTDFRSQYTPGAMFEREMRGVGAEARRRLDQARQGAGNAAHTAGRHLVGRAMTRGELNEILWMFGTTAGFSQARIVPHNFWAPYPNRRAMTPDGNIYFHGDDYREDFSLPSVPVQARALFMHESTHLYQHYILGYHLMVSGPLDRDYEYTLEKGKPLRDYGIEQMGSIVQDFYQLRHGRKLLDKPIPRPITPRPFLFGLVKMKQWPCLMIALLSACGSPGRQVAVSEAQAKGESWWAWHDRKREVDSAVSEAINESGGGDYAKAVAITRASDRPDDVKSHQIGMLIIGGFDSPGATRSPETLEQGVRMVENATTMGGEMQRNGPQKLRLMFERGIGIAPNAIPKAPEVAACWLAVERHQSDDAARCIALRRQRLPHVGR